MFQSQRGNLASSLTEAGLPQRAAVLIANILGNSKQTLRSGPIEQDTTPRNMRQVTRTDKLTLPNLDFKEGDPEHQRRRIQDSEDKPESNVSNAIFVAPSPQVAANAQGIENGNFVDAVQRGNATAVNLRIHGANEGMVTVNAPDNSLLSRPYRATTNANALRFFITDNNREVVWQLMLSLDDANFVDVVTDLRLEGNNIVADKTRIYPLAFEVLDPDNVISVADCP